LFLEEGGTVSEMRNGRISKQSEPKISKKLDVMSERWFFLGNFPKTTNVSQSIVSHKKSPMGLFFCVHKLSPFRKGRVGEGFKYLVK